MHGEKIKIKNAAFISERLQPTSFAKRFLTLLGYCPVLIRNFYGRFGTARCSPTQRSSTARGIDRTELNMQIQVGNAPVAVGHYGGSLKLDSSGLCEI